MVTGLALGFAAAFLQACSFAASARYVRVSGRPAWTLIPPAFLWMGVAALPFLAFVRPAVPGALPVCRFLLVAALGMLTCAAGNGFLFLLQRNVDSSRTTPLLALKVPLLAAFAAWESGRGCSPMEFVGVALVIASAAVLAGAGRPIPPIGFLWLVLSCAGFCASDICIVKAFEIAAPAFPGSSSGPVFFTLFGMYAMGGAMVAPMLLAFRKTVFSGIPWRLVRPYAACWLAAMAVLFVCFDRCGLVLGNIVQSTRGLLAVAIGWFIARAGRVELEERVSRSVFARRVAAAVLIVLAIILYSLGRR